MNSSTKPPFHGRMALRLGQRRVKRVSQAFPRKRRVSVIPLDLDSHDISPELVVRGIQDVGTIHHVILSCELNCFGNLPFNAKLPIIDEVSRGVALEFLTALVVLPFDEREQDGLPL
jgi:hypothetical protein